MRINSLAVKRILCLSFAGALYKAYVDTVPVKVTSGQITITFIAQVENPRINALEIIPE